MDWELVVGLGYLAVIVIPPLVGQYKRHQARQLAKPAGPPPRKVEDLRTQARWCEGISIIVLVFLVLATAIGQLLAQMH